MEVFALMRLLKKKLPTHLQITLNFPVAQTETKLCVSDRCGWDAFKVQKRQSHGHMLHQSHGDKNSLTQHTRQTLRDQIERFATLTSFLFFRSSCITCVLPLLNRWQIQAADCDFSFASKVHSARPESRTFPKWLQLLYHLFLWVKHKPAWTLT